MNSDSDLSSSWLGHATLRLEAGGTVVYTDPGRHGVLDDYVGGDGDIVCVSHDHHYDPDGIRTVADSDCTLVLFEGIDTHRIDRNVDRPVDLPFDRRTVDAESDIAIEETIIRTTAAYNEADGPHVRDTGEPYHPKGRGCGFHLTIGGTAVYCPGDTDVLDGHGQLDVDIFCPPIGGTMTMDREEAVEVADCLDPDLIVPIHYDTFEAIEDDAAAFGSDCRERGLEVSLDP